MSACINLEVAVQSEPWGWIWATFTCSVNVALAPLVFNRPKTAVVIWVQTKSGETPLGPATTITAVHTSATNQVFQPSDTNMNTENYTTHYTQRSHIKAASAFDFTLDTEEAELSYCCTCVSLLTASTAAWLYFSSPIIFHRQLLSFWRLKQSCTDCQHADMYRDGSAVTAFMCNT